MQFLLSALQAHAREMPERVILSVKETGRWRLMTAADLLRYTNGWARSLVAAGLPRMSVIFIILPHDHRLFGACLGAMRAGLVPSFLPVPTSKQDPDLYWSSHAAVLDRVAPSAIITCSEHFPRLSRLVEHKSCRLFDIDDAMAEDGQLPALDIVETPRAVAILQHSSGTTGLKKGVEITFDRLARQIDSYAHAISMTTDDCVASWLPLYHDMGLITGFLMPLTIGCRIVSIGAFDWLARPDQLLHLIKDHRATLCWLPNFAFNHLARTRDKRARYDLASIRAFVSCSEPCRAETLEKFTEAFAAHALRTDAVAVCYAMAETVFAVTQTPAGAGPVILHVDGDLMATNSTIVVVAPDHPLAIRLVSCGLSVDGISTRIQVSPGQDVGEVEVFGAFVFDAYHGDPESARTAFTDDGWYRTGDIGFMHAGELFICGRAKEILIVHGRNYYAADIEAAVSEVSGIKAGRAVAFGIVDTTTASEEAVVMAESDGTASSDLEARVKQAVMDRLGLSLRQMVIVPAGQVIKTSSGKMSRSENKRRFLMSTAPPSGQVASVPPGSTLLRADLSERSSA